MTEGDLTARDIAQMLNKEAARLARQLYPAGHEAGGYWCIGNIHGASGNSLKIRLQGDRQGTWADYACDEGDPQGKGDMLKLVMFSVAEQQTVAAAIRWAKGWLGIESMNGDALEAFRRRQAAAERRAIERRDRERHNKRRQAEGLWLNAAPLIGTPAFAYLTGRGIDFAKIGHLPGSIRFRPDVGHAECREKQPAMATAFRALDGTFAAVHLTFLERRADGTWGKLSTVEDPKKIRTPGSEGSHMPINKGTFRGPLKDIPAGMPVYVSEGIEDALTYAMARPDARIVAAGTLGRIGVLDLPPQAGDLIIIGQNDPEGSKAAESFERQLAKQQARAAEDGSGRRVKILWPPPAYKDFNDFLTGKRMGEREPNGPQAA